VGAIASFGILFPVAVGVVDGFGTEEYAVFIAPLQRYFTLLCIGVVFYMTHFPECMFYGIELSK